MKMTTEEQLRLWAAGHSVHNEGVQCIKIVRPDGVVRNELFLPGGECCPDFSCCQPGVGWPIWKRQKFLEAGELEREDMLVGALRGLLDYLEIRKVHIVGPQ